MKVGFQEITLRPGQFTFSQRKAAKELNMGRQEIRTALAFLIKAGNLTHSSTHQYSIITIVNWDVYQGKATEANPLTNQILTHCQPTDSRKPLPDKGQQPGEECKECRRIYRCQVDEIFTYWQQVMGHSKAKLTKDRTDKIRERLKEGYTVEDIKKAIDGCRATPHNMGDNERKTVYDDIELICRKGSKLEHFIHNAERKPKHTFVT